MFSLHKYMHRFLPVLILLFILSASYQSAAQEDIDGKKPKKVKVKHEKPEKVPKEKKEKTEKEKKADEPKQVKAKPSRKPKIAPPGTVMLNDSVYIDMNPIKNIDYREFVSFLGVTYSAEVRDSLDNLPFWGVNLEEFRRFMRLSGKDTDLLGRMRIRIDQILSWAQSMEEYLNNPTFNENPVIYISYNQANEYALWRSRIVMFGWAVECKNEKQREKYYKKIRYRLPTPEEWDQAMDLFSKNVILNKAIFPHNIACTYPAVPQRGKSEFFYVPGNICEMTSVEHLAVGISWKDSDTTGNYKKRVDYFGPRDWLGFRCVCEVVEY
jgi:uncharacterized protein YbdZ (MbtH family)